MSHAWRSTPGRIWVELLQDLSVRLALLLRTRARSERAQTLIEYGLMAALIALVAISAVALVGAKVPNILPAADKLHS